MADSLAAILMVESWFEHRATLVNPYGNIDTGLGQASDYCRQTLSRLAKAGHIDFPMADQDYKNPWLATRAAAVWFALMLDEMDGNLNAAIRAYHRGGGRAARGEGVEYLSNVLRKRDRFIRNQGGTPAWSYLFNRTKPPTGGPCRGGDRSPEV